MRTFRMWLLALLAARWKPPEKITVLITIMASRKQVSVGLLGCCASVTVQFLNERWRCPWDVVPVLDRAARDLQAQIREAHGQADDPLNLARLTKGSDGA